MSSRATPSSIACLAIIIALLALPWHMAQQVEQWRLLWVLMALLLIAFLGLLGYGLRGHFAGIIIDNRNRVSLSKLQMVAWTVVVITGLTTAATINVAGWGHIPFSEVKPVPPHPLDIAIPQMILAAMGLAGASLIGTPLILSGKMSAQPRETDIDSTARQLGLRTDQMNSAGLVFAHTHVADASWLDLFRGDEVSNAASIDLSKVQQFLITVLLLAAYSADTLRLLGDKHLIGSLPPLSEGMVWLMSISHGAYLTFKWVPHGRVEDTEATKQTGAGTGVPTPNMRSVG